MSRCTSSVRMSVARILPASSSATRHVWDSLLLMRFSGKPAALRSQLLGESAYWRS
uniref:Uncharacterized protein n=1 Tax=Arundo donax TaxID=35708 RepID=A0A0A9D289_ARUDO